jgi:putative transposase
MYHFVCPAKYRLSIFSNDVEASLVEICSEIAARYEIEFLEIGADENHVHFLVQCAPTYSPTQIVRIIKSLTARELFSRFPNLRKSLWGGSLWTSGYFVATVGRHAGEDTIRRYVAGQGTKDFRELHRSQLNLFDEE